MIFIVNAHWIAASYQCRASHTSGAKCAEVQFNWNCLENDELMWSFLPCSQHESLAWMLWSTQWRSDVGRSSQSQWRSRLVLHCVQVALLAVRRDPLFALLWEEQVYILLIHILFLQVSRKIKKSVLVIWDSCGRSLLLRRKLTKVYYWRLNALRS